MGISPTQSGWKAQRENSQRASGIFPTQQKAIEAGIEIAKNNHVEVIIQKTTG